MTLKVRTPSRRPAPSRRKLSPPPPDLHRSFTGQPATQHTDCFPITTSPFWPDDEGCSLDTIEIITLHPKFVVLHLDRFGGSWGGYFGVTHLEINKSVKTTGIPTYMARAIKWKSPTLKCKTQYEDNLKLDKNDYHRYILNREYRGIVRIAYCNANKPEWLDRLEADGKITPQMKESLYKSPQCLFLIPDHKIKEMFGRAPNESRMVNDPEHNVLIDKGGKPDAHPHIFTDKPIYTKTKGTGKKYYVYTVEGLLREGIITDASKQPDFIEPSIEGEITA
jgi:hypothetical protein